MTTTNSISSLLLTQLHHWRFATSPDSTIPRKIATTLAIPLITIAAAIETVVYSIFIAPSYLISWASQKPLHHFTILWQQSIRAFMQSFELLSENFSSPSSAIVPTGGTPQEYGSRFLHAIRPKEPPDAPIFSNDFQVQGIDGRPFEYVILQTIVYFVLDHPFFPLPSFLQEETKNALQGLRENDAFIKDLKIVYLSPELMKALSYSTFRNCSFDELKNSSVKAVCRASVSLKGIEEAGSLFFGQCWTPLVATA